jgi:hypothetical protein
LFNKNFWDSAKPSVLAAKGTAEYKGRPIPWDDKLVDDVRRTLKACTVFLYYPVWILNNGGIGAIATSQAGSMTTDGTPNDVLGNLNVSLNKNSELLKGFPISPICSKSEKPTN